jgi:signal transduction histidine kinase
MSLSFMFLFYFGTTLIVETIKKHYWLRYLPIGIFIFWLLWFFAFPIFISSDLTWWTLASETWTRYLLAFPGALCCSYAFWLQYHSLKKSWAGIAKNFLYVSLVLGIYAVAAGLVVPKTSFFPASFINVESFLYTFRIPVQIIRALCGMAMAYFVIKALEVFDLENRKNLEEARGLNLLFQERNRFGRDLHDGIIQHIYVVGLQLENTLYLVKEDSTTAQKQIKDSMNDLNNVVREIRNYILDLQPTNFQEPKLNKGLIRIIENFRANSLMQVDLQVKGIEKDLPIQVCNNLYHIVQEALNNVLKHSKATLVEIDLEYFSTGLKLVIRDNGQGLNPQSLKESSNVTEHRGLKNMQERSELIKASLEIKGDRGEGTEITLKFQNGGEQHGED